MLFETWVPVRDLLEMGGTVLSWITISIFLMWALIVERILYLRGPGQALAQASRQRWEARPERRSWHARRIREALVSELSGSLRANIPLIRTLVALCPLLGILGTVTGMIEVFDVMASAGTGNARSMAAGVAKATVPTMAGMVGALSGVFAASILARRAAHSVERFNESLTLDH